MDELFVSASDLRVHLKDLANDVAAGARRVVVLRHGYPMVAVVSQEDLAFLRNHRPGQSAAAAKDSGIPEVLAHPEIMPLEEVERLYRVTKGSTETRVRRWREKAFVILRIRTGEYPEDSPYS